MSEFYTKDELELLGSSAPSDDSFEPPYSDSDIDNIRQSPMQQGMTFEGGIQYQQHMDNAPQFIRDMQDPTSKTYRNIHMGASIANSIKLIILGLIFALVPISMIFSVVADMKANASEGMIAAIPLLMVLLFVVVGISVFVKGIRELIRAIKNK